MSYYVCMGEVNYLAGNPEEPTYKDNYFADYFNYWKGYAKTPQELNLTYPFPNTYRSSDNLLWQLRTGVKPDNHQFHRTRALPQKSQLDWIPRNREKYQDPAPAWNSINSNTPGLWKNLKRKGEIK